MKINNVNQQKITGSSIVRKDERLSLSHLSFKIVEEHTVHSYALRLIFTEALLAGAGDLSRQEFIDAVSLLGSEIDISLEGFYIHISLETIDTSLKKSLTLLEMLLKKPRFDDKEIKRIKEYLKNNLILSKEDAKNRALQDFYAALTNETDVRHPFPIDHIIKALDSVSKNDLKAFHKKIWSACWLYTTGGSEVSCTNVANALIKIRENSELQIMDQATIVSALQAKKCIVSLIDIPNKQNIEFSIGNAVPVMFTHEDFPALNFGVNVLGIYGGFTGRLMSIVREKEGLTYTIYCGMEQVMKSQSGFWRILTFFNPKDVVNGITSTLREVYRIAEEGITEDELKRFKTILATRYALIEDSLIKKVKEAHRLSVRGINEDEYTAFKVATQKLTQKEVNAALKKYLSASELVISGAGPIEKVEKELRAFSKE